MNFHREDASFAHCLQALEIYEILLRKWQKALNLVSSATLENFWERHIRDSAQLFPFLDPKKTIGDMGSGAGFPGLVLAIMGMPSVQLVEADERKCFFLEEVIRQTGASATVHSCRLETYGGPVVETWVCRAFAPVDRILALSHGVVSPETRLLLLKGKGVHEEVKKALKKWTFRVEFYPSLTHADGQIVALTQVALRGT